MKAVLVTGRSAAWMDFAGSPVAIVAFGNRLSSSTGSKLLSRRGDPRIVIVLGDGGRRR